MSCTYYDEDKAASGSLILCIQEPDFDTGYPSVVPIPLSPALLVMGSLSYCQGLGLWRSNPVAITPVSKHRHRQLADEGLV